MKKLVLFMILIIGFLFSYNEGFSNWDRVRDVIYRAEITGDFLTQITTEKKVCGKNINEETKEYGPSDIRKLLQITGENGVNCNFSGKKIICTFYRGNSGVPSAYIYKTISLNGKYNEIFSSLGVPIEYYENNNLNYSIKLKVKMTLMTTINNGIINVEDVTPNKFEDYTVNGVFPLLSNNTLTILDNSSCKNSIKIGSEGSNIGGSGSGSTNTGSTGGNTGGNKGGNKGFSNECNIVINSGIGLQKGRNNLSCSGDKIEIIDKNTNNVLQLYNDYSGVYNLTDTSKSYEVKCYNGGNTCSEEANFTETVMSSCESGDTNQYELDINDSRCEKKPDGSYNCFASEEELSCEIDIKKICPKVSEETFKVNINGEEMNIKLDGGGIVTETSGKEKCTIKPLCNGVTCNDSTGGNGININIIPDPNLKDKTDTNCDTITGFCFKSQPSGAGWGESTGTKYANLDGNNGTYKYILDIEDKFGHKVTYPMIKDSLKIEQYCEGYPCDKELDLKDKLIIIPGWEKPGNSKLGFEIKSAYPGEFTNRFKLSFDGWDSSGKHDPNKKVELVIFGKGKTNEFLKPISIKEILVSDDNGNAWNSSPKANAGEQNYKVSLIGTGSLLNNLDVTATDLSESSLVIGNPFILSGSLSGIDSVAKVNNANNGFGFKTALGYAEGTTNFLGGSVDIKNLNISYDLNYNGKPYNNISYDISGASIASCEKTLGLKVTGNMQLNGRTGTINNGRNYTDLSKANLRTQVRKNAYNLIRGMNSGDKAGTVLYFKGNKDISDITNLQSGDTLIIKDGNLTIDTNLDKNIGIIVLKDNYKIGENVGDIIVGDDVEDIKAVIYADGGFMNDGTAGSKQLKLDGVLFTRNTIGGGVEVSGEKFILPSGVKTDNLNLATKYDLNYLRLMPGDCSKDYVFWIKYNTNFLLNPPKGFGN